MRQMEFRCIDKHNKFVSLYNSEFVAAMLLGPVKNYTSYVYGWSIHLN